MKISKAIIPLVGPNARFSPATNAIPAEMLPLLNKPIIQYALEECVKSNVLDAIMVCNKASLSVAHHFETPPPAAIELTEDVQRAQLALKTIAKRCTLTYVFEHESLGMGHAVWAARHTSTAEDYVAIVTPHQICTGMQPALSQIISVALQEKCSIIAVREVDNNQAPDCTIIDVKKQFSPTLFQVKDIIDKPTSMEAPSNLAVVGRFVLSQSIFDVLGEVSPANGHEVLLSDGIRGLLETGEKVFAYKISGECYDVSSPVALLKTSIALGLQHPHFSSEIIEYLQTLDRDLVVIAGKAQAQAMKQKFVL